MGFRRLALLLSFVTCLVTVQKLYLNQLPGHGPIRNLNNYWTFIYSFPHLLHEQNLYTLYPHEHYDLFKYSPTFAFMMAPFYALPDALGVALWNLVGVWVFVWALWRLPRWSEKSKSFLLLFCSVELITNVQNAQSNGLLAGLMLLAFISLEQQKYGRGALALVASFYIKVFGLLLGLWALLRHPRAALVWAGVGWAVLLGLLPLSVVSWNFLLDSYQSWAQLMLNDHSASQGLSLMAILETWFAWHPPRAFVTAAGLLALALVLWKRRYVQGYDFLSCALVMIHVIVFNHRAESPTYIIAVAGVGLWYFSLREATLTDHLLAAATLVLTSLSPTEIFPLAVKKIFFDPWHIKALPCVLVWLRLVWQGLALKPLVKTPSEQQL